MALILLVIEQGLAALAGVIFMAVYFKLPWFRSRAGRHMMAITAVMTAEAVSLLVVLFRIHISVWIFVIVYGLMDLVVIQRLVLLMQALHTDTDQGGQDGAVEQVP